MGFNSYEFIFILLPVFLALYFISGKLKLYSLCKIILLSANIVFYISFNYKSLIFLLMSIVVNYCISKRLKKSTTLRKSTLLVGLSYNIGMLVYFKYMNFFVESLNNVMSTNFNFVHVIIPIGISFYTFQQIMFIVDSFRNEVEDYSFLDYAMYISFFPCIVQGPIAKYDKIIPQLKDNDKKHLNSENMSKGLYLFALGLSKKVLIADRLAGVVAYGFSNYQSLNSTTLIITALCYTFQLYFDFSGYCDMASGVAKMLNIELPINFNSPYKSLDIIDFWKRWHMTLTNFLTKYLYIPLGGNRKGKLRGYLNSIIVFVVSGFWHGANWTFVLWGLLHGVAQVLNKIFKIRIDKMHPALRWISLFVFVNFAWIIFRSDTVMQGLSMIKNILLCNFGGVNTAFIQNLKIVEISWLFDALSLSKYITVIPYMFICMCMFGVLGMRNSDEKISEFRPTILKAFITSLLMFWSLISIVNVSVFLYAGF